MHSNKSNKVSNHHKTAPIRSHKRLIHTTLKKSPKNKQIKAKNGHFGLSNDEIEQNGQKDGQRGEKNVSTNTNSKQNPLYTTKSLFSTSLPNPTDPSMLKSCNKMKELSQQSLGMGLLQGHFNKIHLKATQILQKSSQIVQKSSQIRHFSTLPLPQRPHALLIRSKSRHFSTHSLPPSPTPSNTITNMANITITPPIQHSFDPSLLAGDFTLHSLLNKPQRELLRSIKKLLLEIEDGLAPLGLTSTDAQLLRDASNALDELFLVVAFGEFNSGKSSLLNSLMGGKYCSTGVLPTTDMVNVYRHGDKTSKQLIGKTLTHAVPVEWLRLAHVVDTPGVNAIISEHQTISERYIPNADLVLFVSSVERPYSASERAFLQKIHQWGKKIVFVLNKVDNIIPSLSDHGVDSINASSQSLAMRDIKELPKGNEEEGLLVDKDGNPRIAGENPEQDVANIVHFVQKNAGETIGHIPPTFVVSAQLGLKAKEAISVIKAQQKERKMNDITASAQILQQQAIINNSGLAALETYILTQLSGLNKIQIKLSNPLSISKRIIHTYTNNLNEQVSKIDFETTAITQLKPYIDQYLNFASPAAMKSIEPLDKLFADLQGDSGAYLKQKFTLGSILSLFAGKLGSQYIQEVLSNADDQTLSLVSKVSNQLVTSTNQLAVVLGQSLATKATKPINVKKSVLDRFKGTNGNDNLEATDDSNNVNNTNAAGVKSDDVEKDKNNNNNENNDQNPDDVQHKTLPNATTTKPITSTDAFFLLGPHLTNYIGDSLQKSTQNKVQHKIERVLYEEIPDFISQKGKSAARTASTLTLTGLSLVAGALSVFPEPTVMLTGIAMVLSGLAAFPLLRSNLKREIVKKLTLLHKQLKTDIIEVGTRQSCDEAVVEIHFMMEELLGSLKVEREMVKGTLDRLSELEREINTFNTAIASNPTTTTPTTNDNTNAINNNGTVDGGVNAIVNDNFTSGAIKQGNNAQV